MRRKEEAVAKRHAIEMMVSFEEVQRAVTICVTMEEVAEMCELTVSSLFEAIEHFRTKGKELKFREIDSI